MDGLRVWVTRDESEGGPLSRALRNAGVDVLLEPVLERRVVDELPVDFESLCENDWLVLTSAFAVDALPEHMLHTPKLAAVGPATKNALEARGARCALMGPGPGVDALFTSLRRKSPTGRVVYARSNLADVPTSHGFSSFSAPIVYETTRRAFDFDRVSSATVIAVTSPSAVSALKNETRPFASLGPTTSRAVQSAGHELWVEAPTPSLEALAQAIVERHQRA